MVVDRLTPNLDLLREEYVLVQAWKKTAGYVRYHNWFSDTLALDQAAVNLPWFIKELQERLEDPNQWANDPIRFVPAPKSQRWSIQEEGDSPCWRPVAADGNLHGKIRPLAHVSLRDQVLATAVMLCLADRVETLQGDPEVSLEKESSRKNVTSYGNRLLCDKTDSILSHRWGSSALYRAYFKDYRTFLTRPDHVAEEQAKLYKGSKILIVHCDLQQFYDRVENTLLTSALDGLCKESSESEFGAFAKRVLNWSWHHEDRQLVADYAEATNIEDFGRVVLPQGLVASGFFANLVLLKVDEALRKMHGHSIVEGLQLLDVCRYADDIRLTVLSKDNVDLSAVKKNIHQWLQTILERHAVGLIVNPNKTQVAEWRGDARPLIRQSRTMERIQSAVSGGFDATGGVEILDAVQGLLQTQRASSEELNGESPWVLSPVPDVKDATVARFSANRYRKTFRSLRPLLDPQEIGSDSSAVDEDIPTHLKVSMGRTQRDLDDHARAFAYGLIKSWVQDPSNVMLLRIGLDIWPSADALTEVLDLLRQHFHALDPDRQYEVRVASYCLSEVFRAGATQTGIVDDDESLPGSLNIGEYRKVLSQAGQDLLASHGVSLPWYLKQQVYLFLSTVATGLTGDVVLEEDVASAQYSRFLNFLIGKEDGLSPTDFATNAILARRSFLSHEKSLELVSPAVRAEALHEIAKRDLGFAKELLQTRQELSEGLPLAQAGDLELGDAEDIEDGFQSLTHLVSRTTTRDTIRNEVSLLELSSLLLKEYSEQPWGDILRPADIHVKLGRDDVTSVKKVKLRGKAEFDGSSIYGVPKWCPPELRWRFHLGFFLRYILTGQTDFTLNVRTVSQKNVESRYRPATSHWYQRYFGSFSGFTSFGDDWLPISDWMSDFLYALLAWPGCYKTDFVALVESGPSATLKAIRRRISELQGLKGAASGLQFIPVKAPMFAEREKTRPLRVCIVQTVYPGTLQDFDIADLTFSRADTRRRHRRHLSSALAAVDSMLRLRETHRERGNRLDLLVLPELSVHPEDIETHLKQFAMANKTIILAGLTYQEIEHGRPFVNSAMWIIPQMTPAKGVQIRLVRQGKQHLAPVEKPFTEPVELVRGFRPCQWIIDYEWSRAKKHRPLRLTGSVCYDATDLSLASDLRNLSDVFTIPALNRDVATFDDMAQALHYHMFQMVIIANNGTYGGSNAYAPYGRPYKRQIFHLHGQPQASIAFIELDKIGDFCARIQAAKDGRVEAGPVHPAKIWKYPPADS